MLYFFYKVTVGGTGTTGTAIELPPLAISPFVPIAIYHAVNIQYFPMTLI